MTEMHPSSAQPISPSDIALPLTTQIDLSWLMTITSTGALPEHGQLLAGTAKGDVSVDRAK
ncbi:hypothetical protein [Microbacterium aurantiacum]|uniref:hypothetical protein n=1 Tax=Microbacterium aurantiacum TaxID=162393 RepID=UPI004036BF9F